MKPVKWKELAWRLAQDAEMRQLFPTIQGVDGVCVVLTGGCDRYLFRLTTAAFESILDLSVGTAPEAGLAFSIRAAFSTRFGLRLFVGDDFRDSDSLIQC